MPSKETERRVKSKHLDVRVVARKALLELLEPLIGFVLNSGLSTQEMHAILREAAVRSVAAKQLEFARRVNISGIAASTGIPRAEISRILKSRVERPQQVVNKQQQSTNRVLAVWHQDPKFSATSGKPADLKIYGKGATFETLVKTHGRGIPIRAMLDELIRVGAAEVIASELVRVNSSVAVDRGVTPQVIRAFGERATELLSTMLQNMTHPKNPQFVATVSGANILQTEIPLFRKELSIKGSDFLADLHDSLNRTTAFSSGRKNSSATNRISVTIFYHQAVRKSQKKKDVREKRRNFRREA